MNVLLTGAFGNIGSLALEELLRRGHHVRCFDVPTKVNMRAAAQWRARLRAAKDKMSDDAHGENKARGENQDGAASLARGRFSVVWGDLRRPEDLAKAVQGAEAVIHLAFIIPKLSRTGVGSEDRPDWAREINVGGTRNLIEALEIEALERLSHKPRLIFASSIHVYGNTQDKAPPRLADEPLAPIEHYARHKVECEELVRASSLPWTILRFAAALPVRLILDPGMFDVPLENRIEFIHGRDVATALANSIVCEAAIGKTLLIGGGPACQFHYRDFVRTVLEGAGMNMPPEKAFSTVPFATDWFDSSESEALLHYQKRTLDDYVRDMRQILGWRLPLIKAFRPFVRSWLLKQSPHMRAGS